jgi:hypothetical protein
LRSCAIAEAGYESLVLCAIAPYIFAFPATCAEGQVVPLNLKTEQGSEFFTWFHLAPVGTPTTVGSGAWHSFRPTGSAFQKLVEVDVLSEADGKIDAASIGLERAFIDSPSNGVFARDISKSFLTWTLRKPSPQIANLIANLADLSNAGTTILMHGPGPQPPPPDTTGGYGVYLGRDQHASFTDNGATLAFTNFSGALPSERVFEPAGGPGATPLGGSGWLRIDIRFGVK